MNDVVLTVPIIDTTVLIPKYVCYTSHKDEKNKLLPFNIVYRTRL